MCKRSPTLPKVAAAGSLPPVRIESAPVKRKGQAFIANRLHNDHPLLEFPMFSISHNTRATQPSTRHQDGTRARSVVRRGVAPLLAVVLAAAGLAASPAQAADPYIGLEAFAAEPMVVAAPLATVATDTLDNTAFPADLPQPSIASFVIIGKVTQVKPATGTPLVWKIGTGPDAKWVYNRSGTRLDNAPRLGNRVKVIANRLTTGGAGPLVAERITRKAATAPDAALDVEVAYLFTGTLQSAPGAPVWTLTQGLSTAAFDVTGAAPGESVVDPALDAAQGDQVTVEFVPAGTVFAAD